MLGLMKTYNYMPPSYTTLSLGTETYRYPIILGKASPPSALILSRRSLRIQGVFLSHFFFFSLIILSIEWKSLEEKLGDTETDVNTCEEHSF